MVYTNCIMSTKNNLKASMELGFLPDGSEPVLLHEVVARSGIASDLPEAERPVVQVLETSSPRFRTLVEGVRAARGADFSICDVTLPVQVSGAPAPAV